MISKSTKFLLIFFSLISLSLLAAGVYELFVTKKFTEETSKLVMDTNSRSEQQVAAQAIQRTKNREAETLESLDTLVLTQDKLVSVIETVESAGKSIGLEVAVTSVDKLQTKSKTPVEGLPEVINIRLDTQGTWAATLNYLKSIESLPYRVMIDNADIYKGSEEVKGWRSSISFTLYSFPTAS